MKYLQGIVLFGIVGILICSCGGGGGSGDSEESVPISTNTIRSFQSGDSWEYTATGRLVVGTETVNLTGGAEIQVLSSTKQSPITLDNCLDQYGILTLTGGGESISVAYHSYFLQDEYGSIYSFGDEDEYGATWVISPAEGCFLGYESPMVSGNGDGFTVQYSDGTSDVLAHSVGSVEKVSTGIGTYDAYSISSTSTYTDGGDKVVQRSTEWYVPSIGTIKVIVDNSYYVDNVLDFKLSYTATLSSTSIPH